MYRAYILKRKLNWEGIEKVTVRFHSLLARALCHSDRAPELQKNRGMVTTKGEAGLNQGREWRQLSSSPLLSWASLSPLPSGHRDEDSGPWRGRGGRPCAQLSSTWPSPQWCWAWEDFQHHSSWAAVPVNVQVSGLYKIFHGISSEQLQTKRPERKEIPATKEKSSQKQIIRHQITDTWIPSVKSGLPDCFSYQCSWFFFTIGLTRRKWFG